jgi:FXSXX-COOH protein
MSDDMADDVLIDVSGLALDELLDEVDESGLALALERILAPRQDSGYNGFNNSI